MQKYYIGVKAIIRDDRGLLLLQYQNGHWDVPGGRIDEGEDVYVTLNREVSEELPESKLISVGEFQGVYFLPNKTFEDDVRLLLLYYLVETKLTDEHKDYKWVTDPEQLNIEGLYPEIADIFKKSLRKTLK